MGEPRLTLQPFDPADAGTVSSWARSDEEVRLWCSHPRAPVPPAVVASWGDREDVDARVLRVGDRLTAYGELWVDAGEQEVELARLIVAPGERGRGVGRRLVGLLAEQARRLHPHVFLRVHPDHTVALRCYAAAGFCRVSPTREAEWNRGQPARYAWMVHRP